MHINLKSEDNMASCHGAYTLEEHSVNHLLGELLTIIDALGLKETQEKSAKDLVRQKVWETMTGSFYLEGKLFVLAQNMKWHIDKETNDMFNRAMSLEDHKKSIHPPWIKGEYELTFNSKD